MCTTTRADRSAEDRRLRKAEAVGSNPTRSTSIPIPVEVQIYFFWTVSDSGLDRLLRPARGMTGLLSNTMSAVERGRWRRWPNRTGLPRRATEDRSCAVGEPEALCCEEEMRFVPWAQPPRQ